MNPKALYNSIGKLGWLYDFGFSITGYSASIDQFVQALCDEGKGDIRTVLDAGCGTGQYSVALLRKIPSAHIVAFDLSPGMVEHTRQALDQAGYLNRATVFVGDITSPLSEIKETFDAIILSGVVEYVSPEDTVTKLSRFLRPGGYVLHSPVRNTAWAKLVGKVYRFVPHSQERLIKAFTNQGFTLRRILIQKPFPLPSFKEAHIFKKGA